MSNFNALHTALEASVNVLLLAGCMEINLVMSPNYTVDETGQIVGASYRAECVQPAKLAHPTTTVSWDHDCGVSGQSYELKFQYTDCVSLSSYDAKKDNPDRQLLSTSDLVCKMEPVP